MALAAGAMVDAAPGWAGTATGLPHLPQNCPSTFEPQFAQKGMRDLLVVFGGVRSKRWGSGSGESRTGVLACHLFYFPGLPRTTRGRIAPMTAPATKAALPAPRKEMRSPAREPIPAPTIANIRRLPITFEWARR